MQLEMLQEKEVVSGTSAEECKPGTFSASLSQQAHTPASISQVFTG